MESFVVLIDVFFWGNCQFLAGLSFEDWVTTHLAVTALFLLLSKLFFELHGSLSASMDVLLYHSVLALLKFWQGLTLSELGSDGIFSESSLFWFGAFLTLSLRAFLWCPLGSQDPDFFLECSVFSVAQLLLLSFSYRWTTAGFTWGARL